MAEWSAEREERDRELIEVFKADCRSAHISMEEMTGFMVDEGEGRFVVFYASQEDMERSQLMKEWHGLRVGKTILERINP